MRSTILLIVLVLLVAGGCIAQKKVTDISDLSGMAGCWERRDDAKKLLVTEQWMSPAGTSTLGMGRTVKDGKTVDYEFMRIEKRADGIYFVAQPKENNEETAFKLIGSTLNAVTFENREHDFPQRVIYKLQGTVMTGRIEGTIDGKFKGIDFPFAKVMCG